METFNLITGSDVVYIKGRDCGYCKQKKEAIEDGYSLDSYKQKCKAGSPVEFSKYPNSSMMGFMIYMCSLDCYEQLMKRGFRRSGTFLYRNDPLRNCCRLYTIRTNLDFIRHPSRELRHTINRFEKFIRDDTPKISKHSPGVKFNIKERIMRIETDPIIKKRFHTVIESIEPNEEKFQLFKKYQMCVHKEKENEVTMKGFTRFLCKTPFNSKHVVHTPEYWKKLNSEWRKGRFENDTSSTFEVKGPVHECYYLDDKLIAIGVLDILSESVSSVYLIWDPDYAHLGLGNLSALHELVLTEMLGKKYYYMGYYIDDCPKMRYKAKFGGEILDVCSCKYVSLDRAKKNISDNRLVVFEQQGLENVDNGFPLNEFEIGDPDEGEIEQFDNESQLTNVAENIYGFKGGAFTKSERAVKRLEINIPYLKEFFEKLPDQKAYWKSDGKESLPLPLVVPGLIPLWQMNEWEQNHRLKWLLKNVYVCSQTSLTFHRYDPERDQQMFPQIFDFIRLLGPDQFKHPMLYIF